jgi:hypothetical protein
VKLNHKYNLKLWCRGIVTGVKDDLIDVSFEYDDSTTARTLYWHSPDLDKFETHTQGEEWRLNLQPGDKIDALDNTKIWYKSIVVKREFRTDNYNPTGP